MTHRERFIKTITGGVPDRIPIVANLTIQVAEKLAKELGCEVGFVDSGLATRVSHRDILLKLGNDAVLIAAARQTPNVVLPNGDVRDEWGMQARTVGLYSEVVARPLSECESVADLDKYVFPDPEAPARWEFAKTEAAKYKNDYAIIGDLEACIFEQAWNMAGLEKFLCDLLTGEGYIEALLDRIEDYSTKCGLKLIECGCDMIWAGDDFGTQNGMMISPELWRENFKPRYERMFRIFKNAKPDLKIAYHSCGSIVPIIPDYIEIGLDFLNPIQPQAVGMNLAKLYEQYGGEIGFFGGVDVQGALPRGTTDDVRREVRRVIDAVRHSPRFIIAPAHNIQPDTSLENVLAFFDEAIKYGRIGA